MKRYLLVIVLLACGALLIRFFMIKNPPPVPSETAAHETVTHEAQPKAGPQPIPLNRTITPTVQLPPQASTNLWREKLLTLQQMTELFGDGAEERFKELTDFVGSLKPADLPDAVKELQALQAQNPTAVGRELQLRLLKRWTENDARSAADWVAQMSSGSEQTEAVAAVAGAWAEKDLTAAADWAAQLPDGAGRQSAQASVAAEAVYTSPMEALKLASTLAAGSTRDDIITRATAVWAASSPDDAISWAKQILDDTLRQQVISGIATTWGASNPVAAANLAINSLSPGELQDRTVVAIVQRWGLTDPTTARTWVNEFPKGALRERASAVLDEIARRQAQQSNAQTP
jgi:hypothetical protein